MLREDQVAELLARCEGISAQPLRQIRGNLRKGETRAPAVWELLCIDAFSRVGHVAYEPSGFASSPDIVLSLEGRPDLWIELAYLFPRDWNEARRRNHMETWLFEEARRLSIEPVKLSYRLVTSQRSEAGYSYEFPEQHRRKEFMRSAPIRAFFHQVCSNRDAKVEQAIPPFSLILTYDPTRRGAFGISGGGLVAEAPTVVHENNLFKSISSKGDHHRPSGPYIVCVGSDASPAISRVMWPGGISEREAVVRSLDGNPNVSAVLVVGIESGTLDSLMTKRAYPRLYVNQAATHPLNSDHRAAIESVDFNRWKFGPTLHPWDQSSVKFLRSGGGLGRAIWRHKVELTIPETVLVECLAGKTTLEKAYGSSVPEISKKVGLWLGAHTRPVTLNRRKRAKWCLHSDLRTIRCSERVS